VTSTAPRPSGARTAEPSAASSGTAGSGLRARLLEGARQGRWLRPVLVANLVAQVVIVITGGVVRLTGSGLGCPDWPTCAAGSIAPVVHQAEGFHKYIEFGNRLLTGPVGILAVAALVAVLLLRPARPRLRLVAALPLVGVLAQAVIGGITVHTDLSPITVSTHFLVSMGLIAVSTLLLLRAGEGDGAPRPVVPTAVRTLAVALSVTTAAVLVVGTVVTGSGPHSGDADQPARYGFDPRTVSWLHADLVLLLVGLLVGLLVALHVAPSTPAARRRAWWVLGVVLVQGLIGYVQYATDLPVVLVALHMLGACLLVVAVTALWVSLRERTDELVSAA
jgi:cytochrome c oxidase assembly protein subunit 15